MNKLEKQLLAVTFSGLNEPQMLALIEVIDSCPNPRIAVEILCDAYEEKEVQRFPKPKLSYSNRVNLELHSFDRMHQRVKYSYNKVDSIDCWVPKGTKPSINDVSKTMQAYDAVAVASRINIPIDEFKATYERISIKGTPSDQVEYDDCSLESWQD